ncbi:AAA family ATPase, partial [candidate division TA06 bacterium]|nr:AAA family ATPase [candidate division TA06 bacterium]
MYEEYWGLREKPFENTPNPRFFYHSKEHEEAFSRLIYAIRERKGAALISGEYGCGKTLLARSLMRELDDDRYEVAILSNPKLSATQFLKEVVYQLGGGAGSDDKVRLMHELHEILYGNFRREKETVLLIDEAQAIPNEEVFEEIRLLLNFQLDDRFLLTLLLLGQPELRQKVEQIPQLSIRGFQATPLMVEGILYLSTALYQAAAVDAGTGDT